MNNSDVGRINLGLNILPNQLDGQLRSMANHAERSANSIFAGIGKKIGATIGVVAIKRFTQSCINLGSDMAEVQNVSDTAFTHMKKNVDSFAKTAIDKFGLSETVTKQYIGTYGMMSQAMGISEKSAYDMSKAVTELTGDVASFYNLDSKEAYTKLKSIWTGETESLKDLGVVMTQTNLDQYALNNGFGKTTKNMTEQEKVMLRYQYVTSTLSKASGDFQRTSGEWANQTRVLALRFEQLKATLGQGFINVLLPVINMLNGVISRLQVAADWFNNLTKAIFGIKESSSSKPGSSIVTDLENIEGSANSASDAVAKANKQLAGFDKLNTISSSSVADTIGNGSASFEVPTLSDVDSSNNEEAINNSTLVKWLDSVKEKLEPTKKSLSNLYDSGIKPLINFSGQALFDFYNNFLKPVGSWALGKGLPGLVDSCTNLFKYIDWGKLNKALADLWTALVPLTTSVGDGFIEFLNDSSNFIGQGIGELFNLVANGVSTLSKALGGADNKVITAAGESIGMVLGAIAVVAGLTKAGSVLKSIGGGLTTLLGGISKYKSVILGIGGVAIAKFISDMFDNVSSIDRKNMKTAISELSDAMDNLGSVLDKAKVNYKKAQNKNNKISITVDAYFELANKPKLSGSEKKLLQAYAKELTKEFPDLNKVIDTHTGYYKGTEEEIRKMIKAHQDYVMQVASEKALADVTGSLMEAQLAVDKADEELRKANDRLGEQIESVPDWAVQGRYDNPIAGVTYNAMTMGAQNDVNTASKAVYDAKEELKAATEEQEWYLKQSAKYSKQYADSMNNTTTKMVTRNTTQIDKNTKAYHRFAVGAKTGTDDGKKNLVKGLGKMKLELETYYKNSSPTIDKINKKMSNLGKTFSVNVDTVLTKYNQLLSGSKNSQDAFGKALYESTNGLLGVPFHASGCYVKANTPQLAVIGDNTSKGEFVAPEDKLENLLNRAVASGGSALNNAEALALLRDLVRNTNDIKKKETNVNISPSDTFNAVRNEARVYTKRTGRSAFN